jgi:polynucleotide 5'-kinase involved in rRNA processing
MNDAGVRDHLYFIDTDIGQPNFTLPGQVSLSKLSDQDQELPAIDTVESFFTNSANPSENPDYYLECINKLIQTYKELSSEKG